MDSPAPRLDFSPSLPRPAVCCTIVKVTGSHPQEIGARMWVTAGNFLGTLGGGEFERRVLEEARALLAEPGAGRVKEYVLCRALGQCCGGRAGVFFEVAARRKAAHRFGGGHVGRALAEVLSGLPFDVHVVDPRPRWGDQEGLPADAVAHRTDPLADAAARVWSAEDAACVFTHSHELDLELVRRLLPTRAGYLGLIGSEHKAEVFRARLQGLPGGEELVRLWDERLHCPIGAGERLPGKNPKAIAISIAQELLQIWASAPAGSEKARA